jgi:hypothetical protein
MNPENQISNPTKPRSPHEPARCLVRPHHGSGHCLGTASMAQDADFPLPGTPRSRKSRGSCRAMWNTIRICIIRRMSFANLIRPGPKTFKIDLQKRVRKKVINKISLSSAGTNKRNQASQSIHSQKQNSIPQNNHEKSN